MLAGLSTLGITFGIGVGTSYSTASYNVMHRINSIGGINIEPETIDASALADFVERTIAGRATTGGNFTVGINLTDETLGEQEQMIADYKSMGSGEKMFAQINIPGLTKGFFVSVQPPQELPYPDTGQNELLVLDVPLTIEEVIGYQTKVTMDDSETP